MVNATNGVKDTFLFTSESVGEGHPDKIACELHLPSPSMRGIETLRDGAYDSDQVSDAILDACLMEDPLSKVRTECHQPPYVRCRPD